MNNLSVMNKLQDEMKNVENYFDSITGDVLKFKEDTSKKLNEIKMSLNRPRIPTIGMGPGLDHPYSFDAYGNK